MTEEEHNNLEDLEEDTALVNDVFRHLNIHKQLEDPDGDFELRPSNNKVGFVSLPCGHQMPADYVVAWFKCYLKQKQTNFSCPASNESKGKICGAKLSYQEICHLIPLTDKQREFLEENLAALVARRLFDFKACPGCQSNVERRDRSNLCVKCTICTANLKRTYNFCWTCRREWKGATNAVRCDNTGCGQTLKTPDPLKKSTPEFKRQMLEKVGDDIYPVKDKSTDRKRLALIVNNVEFRLQKRRTGAEKDELNMERLLKALGYTVVTLRDLSAKGMSAAMQDFARREEHAESDSCFVVFMSHGDPSGICGVLDPLETGENDNFPTDEIFDCLNTLNCAGLRDKPKIILIQSCRGGKEGSVVVWDSLPKRNAEKEHLEKDFCCLRSSTPDTASYRHPENGSHFFLDIVEIFNKHAHQDDIEELFRKVLKKFKEKHPDQMPCKERTSLSKRFYLFPGL